MAAIFSLLLVNWTFCPVFNFWMETLRILDSGFWMLPVFKCPEFGSLLYIIQFCFIKFVVLLHNAKKMHSYHLLTEFQKINILWFSLALHFLVELPHISLYQFNKSKVQSSITTGNFPSLKSRQNPEIETKLTYALWADMPGKMVY